MRYAPITGPLRNIRRVEYSRASRRSQTRQWQVHFTFKGQKPVSQSFSDLKYGGKENALAWAKRFRNAMEHEFAASDVLFGQTGHVRTGVEIGISRSSSKRTTKNGVRIHWYWQATWPTVSGKQRNRKFHDGKYGGSDAAKQKAIAARQEGIQLYQATREGRGLDRDGYDEASYRIDTGRAPYSLFMPPPNLDVPIWRYMDFTKFVSLLQNGGLFFPTVAQLNDPFEGSFARGNHVLRPMVYRHIRNEVGITAGDLVQRLRSWVAASCWHANEHESAGMWKLYAKSNEAVCIQSTFRRLRDSLGSDVRVGTVRYVDYETDWIPESNPLAPFLYKRKSFEHEREVRALIPLGNLQELQKQEEPTPAPTSGIWKKLDLPAMVERVFVAPDAPDWFFALVSEVTKHYGISSIPAVKSSLANAPLY